MPIQIQPDSRLLSYTSSPLRAHGLAQRRVRVKPDLFRIVQGQGADAGGRMTATSSRRSSNIGERKSGQCT